MAATSAALKLGSLVKEEAICSTKTCGTSGKSSFDLGFLVVVVVIMLFVMLLDLDFVKSKVSVDGAGDEFGDANEHGTEPATLGTRLEFEVVVVSIWEGGGWLCSP